VTAHCAWQHFFFACPDIYNKINRVRRYSPFDQVQGLFKPAGRAGTNRERCMRVGMWILVISAAYKRRLSRFQEKGIASLLPAKP
jgi:hypothetical protein